MASESIRELVETTPTRRQRWRRVLKQFRRAVPFVVGILVTLVGLFLYNRLSPPPDPLTTQDIDNSITEALAAITPAPAHSALVYETILPSLVFIQARGTAPGGERLLRWSDGSAALVHTVEGLRPIANPYQEAPPVSGIGSGVVVNDDGAILTALHVVVGAAVIDVLFADGTRTQGEIVGADPENDIAVLQVEQLPEIFVPATLGNPGAMRVGDEAYVVGSPLGLAGSMSAGIISGFDRTYRSPTLGYELTRLIQFDAAVNPGTDGGPLLNRNGEVIGIVVASLNPSEEEAFSGIGLAVRIDEAGSAAGAPPQ